MAPLVSDVRWLSDSVTELFSILVDSDAELVLPVSLVSRRSIMRDTVAIPAFTSLLTSEPMSDIEVLRENNLSLHPFVLFEMDSLYLKRKLIINIDQVVEGEEVIKFITLIQNMKWLHKVIPHRHCI